MPDGNRPRPITLKKEEKILKSKRGQEGVCSTPGNIFDIGDGNEYLDQYDISPSDENGMA